MKNFGNKKNFGGGKGGYKKPYGKKPSFGGPRKGGFGFGGGDRDERPALHAATCNKCGAECEVPFKPNGKKPIYCRECFRKEDGATAQFERPRYDRAPSFEKPAYRSTPRVGNDEVTNQLKALNAKMDQILEALLDLGQEDPDGEDGS